MATGLCARHTGPCTYEGVTRTGRLACMHGKKLYRRSAGGYNGIWLVSLSRIRHGNPCQTCYHRRSHFRIRTQSRTGGKLLSVGWDSSPRAEQCVDSPKYSTVLWGASELCVTALTLMIVHQYAPLPRLSRPSSKPLRPNAAAVPRSSLWCAQPIIPAFSRNLLHN